MQNASPNFEVGGTGGEVNLESVAATHEIVSVSWMVLFTSRDGMAVLCFGSFRPGFRCACFRFPHVCSFCFSMFRFAVNCQIDLWQVNGVHVVSELLPLGL